MLKATIIGNLGNDPDMRYAASGSPMLRFNVASNYRTRTTDGDYRDRTEWVRVTVTGPRAESLSQYLQKGTKVYVEGRLEARPWTDQQNQLRAGLEVLADEVQFMSSRQAEDDHVDRPARAGVVDDRRDDRPPPRSTAGDGAGGGVGLADRDDELGGLPF